MKTKEKNRIDDLPNSTEDEKKLQPDEATLDLPDVKDISGQEHVRPFLPKEMADITISSADEEGAGLLDTDEDNVTNGETTVSNVERDLLQKSSESMATHEDEQLKYAEVDNTDDNGTPLNEKVGLSGKDLDVPGSEEDDLNEEIGEEDEENNPYSLPDQEEE